MAKSMSGISGADNSEFASELSDDEGFNADSLPEPTMVLANSAPGTTLNEIPEEPEKQVPYVNPDDELPRTIVKQSSSLKTSDPSKKKNKALKVGFSIEEPPIVVEEQA